MKEDKIFYQFSDGRKNYYINKKTNGTYLLQPSLKTVYEDSNLFNGKARINVGQKNKKGAYILPISFLLEEEDVYGIDYINKVFYSEPQLCFFYSKDKDKNIQFFYNYADPIKPPQQQVKYIEELGQEKKIINIELQLITPNFYKCDNQIQYYNSNEFVTAPYWGDGTTYWGGTNYWGEGSSALYQNISDLSLKEKLDYFDTNNANYSIIYNERFFGQGLTLNSDGIILDYTLTTNTQTTVQTNENYTDTSDDGHIYLIELPQLAQNEFLEIGNDENNSGWKIQWLDVVSSPSTMVWNSYWSKLYDVSTGNEISIDKYLQIVPTNYNSRLYFNSRYTINPIVNSRNEIINLTKNTSGNYRVKIELLRTYS